jgi:hypothetical protein
MRLEVRGIPHLAKNERDARISCTWAQETAACAAFIEESRMRCINATKLHRKSGGVGHPSFVVGTEFESRVVVSPLICGWDRVCGIGFFIPLFDLFGEYGGGL